MAMTGMNPDEVKKMAKEFFEKGDNIHGSIARAMGAFYRALKDNWFSPNTKKTEECFYDLDRSTYNLIVSYNNVCYAIQLAYNQHAEAAGLPSMGEEYKIVDYQPDGVMFGDFTLLEISPEGNVVMNVSEVTKAFTEFKDAVKPYIDEVFTVDHRLPFFDETDSQYQIWSNGIENAKIKIRDSYNVLVNEMNLTIEEERQKITSAAKGSASDLNSSPHVLQ